MSSEPYRVEPAKSSRSKCKACKGEIAKDQLRFGSLIEIVAGHGSYHWRCLSCITAKQAANVISKVGDGESVDGVAELSAAARKEFLKAFNAVAGGAAKAAAKGKAKAKAKPEAKKVPAPVGRPPPVKDQHEFLDFAKKHNFAKVRELVDGNPAYVNVQPAGRWTALHQAAEKGDAVMVKFLIEKGARVDLKTKDGKTPAEVAKSAAIKALLVPKAKKRGAASDGPPAKRKATGGGLTFYCAAEDALADLGVEDLQREDPFEIKSLESAKAGKAVDVARKLDEAMKEVSIPAGESDCVPLAFVVLNPLPDICDTFFKVLGLVDTEPDSEVNVREAMSYDEVCWDDYEECGFCHEGEPEDADEDDDENEDKEKIHAATELMANELEEHFKINFSEDCCVAPVVWGGWVDGALVGYVGMRVWT
mmetsp:Transcript_31314/g.73017  ORF Transcript_31314/g.73017 Transcript_31314/m.73017 type:complete len:421 (+) Transcript_31314:101-1363(+)